MNHSPEALLANLNLSLDPTLIAEIIQTAREMQDQHYGQKIGELQIIAIAALVAQNKRLLAVDNHTLVSAGLSIQSFLTRVCLQNRESLLQLVQNYTLKWHLCSALVKQKISYLKRLYSVYLNYYRTFIRIAREGGLSLQLSQTLSSLFWLAYIQRGSGVKTMGEKEEQQRMLKRYLLWTLVDFLGLAGCMDMSSVRQIYNCSLLSRIQQTKLQQITKQVHSNLQHISQFSNLNNNNQSKTHQLLEHNFAQLMLHEYVKIFALKYQGSDSIKIKYTQFFNFNRILTPRPKPRIGLQIQATDLISQRLVFSDEEEEEEIIYWRLSEEPTPSENNSGSTPEIAAVQQKQKQREEQNKQMLFVSPCNIEIIGRDRLAALSWVNKVTNIKGQQYSKSLAFFRQAFDQDLQEFLTTNQKVVQKYITKVAPACVQVEHKSKKTLTVFLNFFATILENNTEEQVKSMFVSTKNMNGFIFMSVMLVACAYKVQMAQLTVCLKQFRISPEEAFIPINWIGSNTDIPHCLKSYIIQIEKLLLLGEIWIEGTGLRLLQAIKQKKVTYLQVSMMKRLKMHVQSIVKQMCEDSQQIFSTVLAMIGHIEEKYTNIFRYNSIEIVILSAFALAHSQQGLIQAAQKTLSMWRNISHYFISQLNFFDQSGTKITFQLFLREISTIITIKQDFTNILEDSEGVRRRETFVVLGELDYTLDVERQR